MELSGRSVEQGAAVVVLRSVAGDGVRACTCAPSGRKSERVREWESRDRERRRENGERWAPFLAVRRGDVAGMRAKHDCLGPRGARLLLPVAHACQRGSGDSSRIFYKIFHIYHHIKFYDICK